jgi:hypothetical protein
MQCRLRALSEWLNATTFRLTASEERCASRITPAFSDTLPQRFLFILVELR